MAYTGDPHSYRDALCTPHSKEWEKALEDKYNQLMRTGAHELNMAASNATKEAIWLHILLEDLGFVQIQATTIHGDNQGCIALS
jgi:hypothetical protein